MTGQRKTRAQLIEEVQQLRQQLAAVGRQPAGDTDAHAVEGRFRILADAAPVLIWMSGTDALCYFFNQPWLTFTGRTLAQEQGKGWTEGVHPDDSARCLATYLTAFHARQPFAMAYRLRRADGEYRWLLDNGVPYFEPDGAFTGYIGSCVDITEHKQLEMTLRQSEEKYRSLIEHAPIGVVVSANNRVLFCNRRESDLFGYAAPADMLGCALTDLIHPGDTPAILELGQRIRHGEVRMDAPVQFRSRRLDGRALEIEAISIQFPYEGATALMSFHQDVTDRQKIGAALRESEQRYRELFEGLSDAVMVFSPTRGFLDCNTLTLERLGYTREEFLQLEPNTLIHPDFQTVGANNRHAIQAGQATLVESRHCRKDGSSFPVEVNSRPIEYQGERAILSVVRDIADRKQAEAALHASKTRYRALFENSDDAILLTAPDGRIYSANPAACHMFGRSEAEICQGGRNALVDVNDPRLAAALAERARTGHVRAELTFLRRDGSPFPGEISSVVFQNEDGERQTSMIIRDIAEREQLQEDLRVSLEKYRILFEAFPLGISITDRNGTILETNRASEPLSALPRTTHAGRTIDDDEWRIIRLDGTPMPPGEYASVRALRDNCMIENVEMGIVTGPGAITWLSVTAAPIPLPGYGVAIAYSDIGDRIRAEEALRQSETTLRVLIDATLDSILLIEPDGVIVIGNETVAARLGQTVTHLSGCNAFDLVPPAVADFRRRQLQTVLQTKRPVHFEDERFGRWIDNSLYPVYNAQGQVARVAIFGRDVTERKQAEVALAQAKEAAEAANRTKGEFLATMSHELRTPLSAILGFSELMTRDPNLSQAQQENLAIINRSGEHLLGLINDVLDMAKIEAGRVTLQKHDFDLHHMLADLMELFRVSAAAKGLALSVTQEPGVPGWVCADESKLRQVLINLVSNAVKFSVTGSIDLAVRQVESTAGCRLHFAVRDSGPGISGEDLAGIFDPFVQLARGHTTQEGTGLGLPISRESVRLMGGELTVASAGVPGEGCVFQFDIPVVPAAATDLTNGQPTGRARALHLAAGQPEYRLLVVDDRMESRKLLTDLLVHLGFAVRTAENGVQALQICQAWRPHLIWMDMRMPVMNGHEATQRIRATAQGQTPIIVALSASVLAGERAKVLAEGCDDFIRKPFREAEIVGCLVKHLGVRMVYTGAGTGAMAAEATPAPHYTEFDRVALPPRWLAQLQLAASSADAARILTLVKQIEGEQPALAATLLQWVDVYDYGAILAAITSAKENRNEYTNN